MNLLDWKPGRRGPPAAIRGACDLSVVRKLKPIPELTRYGFVCLIEPLAVIREQAATPLVSHPKPNLFEPLGVCQRLSGGADQIGLATAEDFLRLPEARNSPRGDHQARETPFAYCSANGCGERNIAAKRTRRSNVRGRHALVTARTGIRIGSRAHLGLLGILELAAFGDAQIVKTGFSEAEREVKSILYTNST